MTAKEKVAAAAARGKAIADLYDGRFRGVGCYGVADMLADLHHYVDTLAEDDVPMQDAPTFKGIQNKAETYYGSQSLAAKQEKEARA
jgi:hypothetical protein